MLGLFLISVQNALTMPQPYTTYPVVFDLLQFTFMTILVLFVNKILYLPTLQLNFDTKSHDVCLCVQVWFCWFCVY